MALRSRSRHLPELLPHFYLGSIGCALTAGWLLVSGDIAGQIQGPPLSLTWLVYWLTCSAALFAVALVWDAWIVGRALRKGWTPIHVPPAVMAIASLTTGLAIPLVGLLG